MIINPKLLPIQNTNSQYDDEIYSCSFVNGSVLYEDPTGTTGDVTLSDNVSNYKRIKIFGYRTGLEIYFILEHDTSKTTNEFVNIWYNTNVSKTQVAYEQFTVSGTTITRGTSRYSNIGSGEGSGSGYFTVYKVIGYKY